LDIMSPDLLSQMDELASLALGGPAYVGPLAASGDDRSVGDQILAATAVAQVDFLPPETVRFRFFKRVLYRFARLFLHRQKAYNLAMINAVADLNGQVAALRARALNDGNRVAASLAYLSLSVEELGDQLDRMLSLARGETTALLDERMALVAANRDEVLALVSDLARAQQGVRASVTVLRTEVDTLRSAGVPTAVDTGTGPVAPVSLASAAELEEFYGRFEDRHRGSLALISERLEPYLKDLDEIRDIGGPVIDVGSGRGEWLDILVGAGLAAEGVDTNSAAVAETRSRGLHVHHADGVAHLRTLPAASVMAVTCFHVVEHLPAALQLDLCAAALRCLKPGGRLIIETPNPTNLNVGAASFYLDPTHLRPVNPDYLAFLLEDLGFTDVQTRFLHPRDGYAELGAGREAGLSDELMWALRGPQDFAVVATAGGGEQTSP
jgi:SAM-dependent methyltransferase